MITRDEKRYQLGPVRGPRELAPVKVLHYFWLRERDGGEAGLSRQRLVNEGVVPPESTRKDSGNDLRTQNSVPRRTTRVGSGQEEAGPEVATN